MLQWYGKILLVYQCVASVPELWYSVLRHNNGVTKGYTRAGKDRNHQFNVIMENTVKNILIERQTWKNPCYHQRNFGDVVDIISRLSKMIIIPQLIVWVAHVTKKKHHFHQIWVRMTLREVSCVATVADIIRHSTLPCHFQNPIQMA